MMLLDISIETAGLADGTYRVRPKEWADGNSVRLELSEKQAKIAAVSIGSGRCISRGYYSFIKEL